MKPTAFFLFSLGPLGLATLVLWLGAPIVVQCVRVPPSQDAPIDLLEIDETRPVPESRVDVTMQQRFLGIVTVRSDTLSDVVAAQTYRRTSRGSTSRGGDTGVILQLTLRDSRTWKSPGAYSPVGTPPHEIARKINEFINTPSSHHSRPMWCVSWVLHLAGLPILFMGLFCAYAGLNVLRKNVLEGRKPNAAFRG